MEIRMHQRSWHGIPLASLESAKRLGNSPAGTEFYLEFYAKLAAGYGRIPEEWTAEKIRLGQALGRLFLTWRQNPRILAVGCGTALVEREWLQLAGDITFNDCQAASMESLKSEIPDAKTIVADARNLPSDQKFDIITLITIDYALAHTDLAGLLTNLARSLAPGGRIVLYCASTLNWRQLAVESGKFILGRRKPDDSVFWGWWRSPAEFTRLGGKCGLESEAYSHTGSGIRRRPKWCRSLMSLRSTNFTIVYRRL